MARKDIALKDAAVFLTAIFLNHLWSGFPIFKVSLPEDYQTKSNNNMAYVIGDDCIACGTCIDECPSEAISEGEKYSINPDLCVDCGTCAGVCPSEAIHPGE